MKRSRLIFTVLSFATMQLHASAAGIEGSIIYQTARPGGGVLPIYDIDPDHPSLSVVGDDPSLYAHRLPALGDNYVAELWIGPAVATETELQPLLRSQTTFRPNVSAIYGNNNFRIPGSLGGDKITVQLRVWARHDGNLVLNTWEDVLKDVGAHQGKSELGHMILGNVSAEGYLYLPQFLSSVIHGFGLSIVPEPSVTVLGAVSLAALLLLRRGSRG